ncbi:MAG: zinc-ribbon domain-containing protein [Firmicutes bacterium]|nr:zinc-ribbon domain-containing protein [Bacillota bacterium]
MPFCRNCGKELSEKDVYCPSCGAARLNQNEKPKNASDYSETLGIVAIILAFIWPLIAIVLSAVGLSVANKWSNAHAKHLNTIAIILATSLMLIHFVIGFLFIFRFGLPAMWTWMAWFQEYIGSHLGSSSSIIRAIL